MKCRNFSLVLTVLFSATVFSASVSAQTRFISQPKGTTATVDGTSTAHDWEMQSAIIGGFLEFGPGVVTGAGLPAFSPGVVAAKVHAFIPVQSLHSKAEHAPDVMDHLMQEHLKASEFNRIDYTLTEMTCTNSKPGDKTADFDTKGMLAIAGKTNSVSFPINLTWMDEGKIKIHAVVPIKMTAYGVEPPAPNIGLGLMRCGDDLKIIIDWTLKERK